MENYIDLLRKIGINKSRLYIREYLNANKPQENLSCK